MRCHRGKRKYLETKLRTGQTLLRARWMVGTAHALQDRRGEELNTSGRECIEFPSTLESIIDFHTYFICKYSIPCCCRTITIIKYTSHSKSWSTLVIWLLGTWVLGMEKGWIRLKMNMKRGSQRWFFLSSHWSPQNSFLSTPFLMTVPLSSCLLVCPSSWAMINLVWIYWYS